MADTLPAVFVREERPFDQSAVTALIAAAFAPMPFSEGTEAVIAETLRVANAATVALVAEREGVVVGQALFSPAFVDGGPSSWHTLGPVAVEPGHQRTGIGGQLITEGLMRLQSLGSQGCIVLGDPGYYARFGFKPAPALAPNGAPAQYFMTLPFGSTLPDASFSFHPAFEASH